VLAYRNDNLAHKYPFDPIKTNQWYAPAPYDLFPLMVYVEMSTCKRITQQAALEGNSEGEAFANKIVYNHLQKIGI
jgi:hypothetical protein